MTCWFSAEILASSWKVSNYKKGEETTKGQTKSKRFFQAEVSSKKRTKEFNFTTMRLVFVRFLEEIEDSKKTFRN